MKQRLKKNDVVIVIQGGHRHLPEERRTGKVLAVDPKNDRVVVEGVNVRRVIQRKSRRNPQGGFIERECPIHLANVMLKTEYDQRRAKHAAQQQPSA